MDDWRAVGPLKELLGEPMAVGGADFTRDLMVSAIWLDLCASGVSDGVIHAFRNHLEYEDVSHLVAAPPKSPRKIPAAIRRRYSLRTLFAISFALAMAFIVMTFIRDFDRPNRAAASPIFMIFGAAGVLLFAAVGHAVGSRIGAAVATGIATVGWLALLLLAVLWGDPLVAQLPLHIVAIVGTILGITAVLVSNKNTPDEDSPQSIQRLMSVKKNLETNSSRDGQRNTGP